MALTVAHPLVSAVPDDGVAGEVGPSEWNADHSLSGTLDIANGGTAATTAATAFANLKQAASDTATGVVELATDAETQTGTDTTRAITPANLSAKEATTAQYRNNTADRLLSTDQVNAAGAFFGLTDGTNIAWDMNSGWNASVTLGGNRTLSNPTNPIVGRTGMIKVTQGAGGQTLAYGTNWEFASATAVVLSTGAGAVDYIYYIVSSVTSIVITGISKAVA
jgi:hypothetical protein